MATDRWTADLWFDPSCPYTWVASRWLTEVARVRPVDLRWHLLSLAALNEGRDDDPEGDPDGYLWLPARVCAAVRREHGGDALARFYTALWTTGPAGAGDGPPEDGGGAAPGDPLDGLRAALAAAGLPRDLADAAHTTGIDDDLRASTTEGADLVGPHVGSPIIAATDPRGRRTAFFGPVLSRAPRGEEAARLWEGTLLVTGISGFHELKGRPPAAPDTAHAADPA
jgi:hypothetical protein